LRHRRIRGIWLALAMNPLFKPEVDRRLQMGGGFIPPLDESGLE